MIQPLVTGGAINPLADPEFAMESAGARDMVKRWLPAMEAIKAAPRKGREIAAQAARLGVPANTMHRRYYRDWRRSGENWRSLVNRAKYPLPLTAGLPPLFREFCVKLYEGHQRNTTALRAYNALMAGLSAWERDPLNPELAMPGYDRPPRRNAITRHPAGWSYQNFCAVLRKNSNIYERTLRRQGAKSASSLLPSVRRSRTELAFGQIFYFDDDQHDTYVNLAGINNTRTLRPLCFSALEALSASRFAMGLKPQMELEGGRTRELDQLDFFWFVMLVLTGFGYNARTGTTLIWEHGTANPDKTGHFNDMLYRATDGLVSVDLSGRFGKPEFKGMLFEGQSSGNFRFKSPLESFFNLFRNQASLLSAPTGRNRDMAPEESHGLKRYNDRFSKLINKLPPDQFLRLRRPVKEWEDYCHWARVIDDIIDLRRDHSLEGWDKLGFRGQRYRLSPDSEHWLSEKEYQLIPAEQREALDHIVARPGYHESFRLSPREVFQGHQHLLTKLPQSIIPVLAPKRAWRTERVEQSLEFVINDSWLNSEPLVFIAKAHTPQGYEVNLERGREYQVLLNIFDPNMLWVAERDGSRDGAFIGTANRVQPSCQIDREGILRQLRDIAQIRADESAEVHGRMRGMAAERVAMHRHNQRVLNEGKKQTRRERTLSRRAEAATAAAGYRTGTPKLKPRKGFTWDAVLENLRRVARNYLRTKEEINKDGLLADRELLGEEKLHEIGVQVAQDESFYITPKLESVAA